MEKKYSLLGIFHGLRDIEKVHLLYPYTEKALGYRVTKGFLIVRVMWLSDYSLLFTSIAFNSSNA